MKDVAVVAAMVMALLTLAATIWQFRLLPRRMYRELLKQRGKAPDAAQVESAQADFASILAELRSLPPELSVQLERQAGALAAKLILLALGLLLVAACVSLIVTLIRLWSAA